MSSLCRTGSWSSRGEACECPGPWPGLWEDEIQTLSAPAHRLFHPWRLSGMDRIFPGFHFFLRRRHPPELAILLGRKGQAHGFLGIMTGAPWQVDDNDAGRGSVSKPWGFSCRNGDLAGLICTLAPRLEEGRRPGCTPAGQLSGSSSVLAIQALLCAIGGSN